MSLRKILERMIRPFVTEKAKDAVKPPPRPPQPVRRLQPARGPAEPLPEWPEEPRRGPAVPPALQGSPAGAPDDANGLDLDDVYRRARIPAAPFTAEQALKALSILPEEWEIETKKQSLRGLLQPTGKGTVEAVATDAERKIQALADWGDEMSKQVEALAASAENKIGDLQRQIAEQRRSIEAARERERQIRAQCEAELDRLQMVLQVLGTDRR